MRERAIVPVSVAKLLGSGLSTRIFFLKQVQERGNNTKTVVVMQNSQLAKPQTDATTKFANKSKDKCRSTIVSAWEMAKKGCRARPATPTTPTKKNQTAPTTTHGRSNQQAFS